MTLTKTPAKTATKTATKTAAKTTAKAAAAPANGVASNGTGPLWGYQWPQTPKPSGYPIPDKVDQVLTNILSWRRPHRSENEKAFVDWLTQHLNTLGYKPLLMSTENNLVVQVPRSDGIPSTTLFSCHTDTVHGVINAPQRQEISYDPQRGEIFLKNGQHGDCLGADDGAGLWLMLELILNKVPGTYVFHRAEECGCIGSKAMANEKAAWLRKFDVAIAFDRKGFTEIITHQSGARRCASDKCATALQTQLHKHGMKGMELSDRGTVTDTLQYRKLIAECFNMATGYHHAHSRDEYLDYAYLVALRDALVKVEWDALPVDRDPDEADPVYTPPKTYYPPVKSAATTPAKTPFSTTPAKGGDPFDAAEELSRMPADELEEYLAEFPESAAGDVHEILLELARTRAERDYYKKRGGFQ